MAFAAGGILATIYLLLGALLLIGAIQVSDLALCSDPDAVRASGEDDCIDTSSFGRAVGIALAYASVLGAVATIALALIFARRRERGAQLAVAAVLTPLLALGGFLLLPIEF